MTDKAVISAVYTEWKMVKTRSALVLCFEVPLEQQELVQKALGTPLQGQSIHVAIARLRGGGAAIEQVESPARKGTLAQQAGILCADKAFWKFLNAKGGMSDQDIATSEAAAKMLRWICQIDSRSALDQDSIAATRFHDLRADYTLWLKGVGA